jgi:hypothetical protein
VWVESSVDGHVLRFAEREGLRCLGRDPVSIMCQKRQIVRKALWATSEAAVSCMDVPYGRSKLRVHTAMRSAWEEFRVNLQCSRQAGRVVTVRQC